MSERHACRLVGQWRDSVDDDVALDGTTSATGARGLAGTIFVHKLVGAAAADGKTLTELVALGKAAVHSLATMGVSFSMTPRTRLD